MKGGMINLCAGRVTYGKKLGYVVGASTGLDSYPLVFVQLCTVTKPGRFFFSVMVVAKGKQHVPSGTGLSGYRGRVAGWLGTTGMIRDRNVDSGLHRELHTTHRREYWHCATLQPGCE